MHEFYSIIKSFKEHLVTIYASNAPLLVFCYKKQNKNTIKAKIQAAWHQSTWLMRYISSPVKSHVNVWPKIRATFKFYTHYFPLRWSSNIICASGWMFVVGWPRINFFMEKSSLNVLLNVFPVVSNRWQGFRLGFLRWTIPLNLFLWKVLVLPWPPATFALLHQRSFVFFDAECTLCLWPCWQTWAWNPWPVCERTERIGPASVGAFMNKTWPIFPHNTSTADWTSRF